MTSVKSYSTVQLCVNAREGGTIVLGQSKDLNLTSHKLCYNNAVIISQSKPVLVFTAQTNKHLHKHVGEKLTIVPMLTVMKGHVFQNNSLAH